MKTRTLGWTGLELSTIGLGTWAMGGGAWQFGWGPQQDEESIAAVHRALDLGINWIDTAPAYGLGHCEELLGRALKGLADRPLIATKCGRSWTADRRLFGSLKRDVIRGEIEASLKRLGVDVIDLYQVHWPQPDEQIEEGWGAIADAVREGKVRYAGVSNFSEDQLRRLQGIHPVASLQPPYSLLVREVENELLTYCQREKIGVVAYSPMQKGLLTGKLTAQRVAGFPEEDHRRWDPMFREPVLTRNLELVGGLSGLAERSGHTAGQLAIAWVLRRPEVTAAIVGARRPAQVEETVAAGDWKLTDEELAEVDRLLAVRFGRAAK